jgi:NAD(P)-dependent dehydrogenase (short-subunit alcohol dehydrogenase family)
VGDLSSRKTIVITGGTSGIGLATAERLAASGARLVVLGYDPSHIEEAQDRLRKRFPHGDVTIHRADLSSLVAVIEIAHGLNRTLDRIDVLINNAGAVFAHRALTNDGLERTFALNHMSYFVLTTLLQDHLIASAPSRVINVSSEMHRTARIDFSDLQSSVNFGTWKAYSRSKLCNILFTMELARVLEGTGVTANCMHPGFVATRLGDNRGRFGLAFRAVKTLLATSPCRAASALMRLAISAHLAEATGEYFVGSFLVRPSRTARNRNMARRLWDESLNLSRAKRVAR